MLVVTSLSRRKPESHLESQVNIFQFVCDRKESENHHSTSFEVVGWLVHLHLNYSKTFTFVFELRHWDKSWGGRAWQQFHIDNNILNSPPLLSLAKSSSKTHLYVWLMFSKNTCLLSHSLGELPVQLVTGPSASEGVERSSQYRILVIFSSQSS